MASFLTTHLPRVELLGEEESTKGKISMFLARSPSSHLSDDSRISINFRHDRS